MMSYFMQRVKHGLGNVPRTEVQEVVSTKIILAFCAAYIHVLNLLGWRVSDVKGTKTAM